MNTYFHLIRLFIKYLFAKELNNLLSYENDNIFDQKLIFRTLIRISTTARNIIIGIFMVYGRFPIIIIHFE